MRQIINLNYNWLFNNEYQDEHIKDYNNLFGFVKVDLPHNAVDIPYHYFDENIINIDCTYKKILYIDNEWKDKEISLVFEGVSNIANVFINDEFVLTNKGGYNTFRVNISEYVKYGENNMLTVYVDSHENVLVPPFGSALDFLGYSGIYREVRMEIIEKEHILNHFVRTYNPLKLSLATVGLELTTDTGHLEISVFYKCDKITTTKLKVSNKNMDVILDVADKKKLWSLEEPNLYEINIKLFNNEDILLDEINDRFAFRLIEFKEDGFYLNGKRIKLIGLNRHQSFPYVGNAMPKSAQYEDADILKYQLGVNIVRTSHYPQSRHFLDRCDEIGLLVFEEVPGLRHIGNDEYKELTYSNLKNMILEHRNHPSIVLWGVRISNSFDNNNFYKNMNEIAKNLDDTRPTTGARHIIKSEFLEGVFAFNDYNYSFRNPILKKKKVTKMRNPYIISEFAGKNIPTKRFDDEAHRLEHALQHLNILNSALNPKNKIAGAIGWCMNDYNTHQEFGAGDHIVYHGVMDMFRLPKLASYVYASQSDEQPVMELSTAMNNGDYPGGVIDKVYVFTNCDYVKLYRNNEYVNTFYPDKENYKYLKHAPIIIDDFIGELLEKHEHIKKRDSKIAKKVLINVAKRNGPIKLIDKIKIYCLLKKYHLSYDDGVKLYYKYLGSWGSRNLVYRFDGYIGDKKVKTLVRENNKTFDYVVEIPRTNLKHDVTYDVAKVIVKKVNQNGDIIPYCFDLIEVNVSGSIELIGPSKLNLIGGTIAFWVKTNGVKGTGTITITTDKKIIETVIVE